MSRKPAKGLVPVREPTGRLSRASQSAVDAVSPSEAKRLMDAAIAGMRGPEWGTEIGRLYLAGKIDAVTFEAGKRWGRLVVAYHRALGAKPPYPRTMTFDRVDPSPEPDTESNEGKRRDGESRSIIGDMREAHAVLIGAGMMAERAVRSVCEENEVPAGIIGIDNLKRGLEWLATHWGLYSVSRKNDKTRHGNR